MEMLLLSIMVVGLMIGMFAFLQTFNTDQPLIIKVIDHQSILDAKRNEYMKGTH